MNRHLSNKGQEGKPGHNKGRALAGEGGQKRIWLMHFLYKNEYRVFKPVEIPIRRGLR
jgi:hypothetical protein